MEIIRENFFKKYRIEEQSFRDAGLVWEELVEIYLDFQNKEKDYKDEAKEILAELNDFAGVSAVRYRVKDKEHLIEKIIRKRINDKSRVITLKNYEKEITDLVGFRVTHIFKDDWEIINKQITKRWQTKEITAFYREGDEEYYSGIGLDLGKMTKKEHPRGYRSVHYILESKNRSYKKNIEIQVRTIFEEAWSEMDHEVIYPYHINNEVLNNYSKILNRVAGMADEMGNFMKKEVASLSELDKLDDENKRLKSENEELKARLRNYQNNKIDENKLKKKSNNNEGLESTIEMLKLMEKTSNLLNPFTTGLEITSHILKNSENNNKVTGNSVLKNSIEMLKLMEKTSTLLNPFTIGLELTSHILKHNEKKDKLVNSNIVNIIDDKNKRIK